MNSEKEKLDPRFTKFFKNGKTFSSFCRMRYGQSKDVWEDENLWCKAGEYAVALDLDMADKKFGGSDETMIKKKI